MKHDPSKNNKKKTFLRIPVFRGGKGSFQQFIKENIIYPDQALTNKVEGFVYVVYTVDNIGEIGNVEVKKGIGSGCDEEAIRVIRLMKYEPARNRGIKMKAEMKTRIHFKLPEAITKGNQGNYQLNYSSTVTEKSNSPEPKPRAVYNYSINIESNLEG